MKLVFADAFYFIALLNAHDAANARAGEFTQRYSGQYVTTTATLIELADAFSNPSSRLAAGRFLGDLPASKAMRIVIEELHSTAAITGGARKILRQEHKELQLLIFLSSNLPVVPRLLSIWFG
jgi:hypothetical protein